MGNGATGDLPSTTSDSAAYVCWEEVLVSSDKARREVHYYLRRNDGSSDLAVVGKEKSPRRMSYHVAKRQRFLMGSLSPPSFTSPVAKLRSRKEVIDWLNSVISEASFGTFDERDAGVMTLEALKEAQFRKVEHLDRRISWLGSSWTCKKKLEHYQSFSCNGIKISVNRFVHVLAEENKRYVAYLKDMYEDFGGKRMVVVQWFHKIDEVAIDLHHNHNYNDREIFFSLSCQDLSIECIDGLATVLCPRHFEQFASEVKYSAVEPFVCHKLYDNDVIKPFDVTGVKGYWQQEVLQHLYSFSCSRVSGKSHVPNYDVNLKGDDSGNMTRPRKRLCLSKDATTGLQKTNTKLSVSLPCSDSPDNVENNNIAHKNPRAVCMLKDDISKHSSHLIVGSQVEILSQDSGLRGCWFKATITKRHKDKIKVRYEDLKDADNEVHYLEEWVLASKIAVHDNLGLRCDGRTVTRPSTLQHNGKVSWVVEVGALVDAWWHDGWWEGIVVKKESKDTFRVYFPDERQEATFSYDELRHSQEWLGGLWKALNGKPDVAALILSDKDKDRCSKLFGAQTSGSCDIQRDCGSDSIEDFSSVSVVDTGTERENDTTAAEDLSNDKGLGLLRWRSSRKRSRAGSFLVKPRYSDWLSANSDLEKAECQVKSLLTPPLRKHQRVDHENCKFSGETIFSSQVVPHARSVVLSR